MERRLGDPYGGALVNTELSKEESESRLRESNQMTRVRPFIDFIYDAEKISIGAYSPLDGFMDSATLQSVISRNRLPSGLPWTIPIILAPKSEEVKSVKEGDEVALLDWNDSPFALLKVREKFSYSKEEFAKGAYGTTDQSHPNVYDIYNNYGDVALAGRVSLMRKLELPTVTYELSPRETRKLFNDKGWKNVVAYQCRNPPHTAHEYIQKVSLENSEIDGLFIQPVIGRLKRGDYKPGVIMEAYKAVVGGYYPSDRVVLSSLSITMRYAGPKAALFYAIVRKNYGSTHYIVGRDQAGVGKFYDPYACHRIFDEFDVGVVPLRYMETFYCKVCKSMATSKTCPHSSEEHIAISQTRMRELLKEGKDLPTEILRPEVIKVLGRGEVILE
ncbi:MAG: sulfate adenylyltransferase [Nitrososphaerota archaeon]|nr:sulfate adenylyltransferase [Nitrososphaerota archaeon]